MKKILVLLAIFCLTITIYGCGSSGESDFSPLAAITSGNATVSGQVTGFDVVANIPVYLIVPDATPASIRGNISLNIPGQWYAAQTDENGFFQFTNVVEGNYNLVAQKDRFHSAVLKNIFVTQLKNTALKLTLTATGDLTGSVVTSNGTSPAGIFVYIPGTSFMATADDDGTFTITGIPAGQYSLAFLGETIEKKSLTDVSVVAGTSTSVGTNIALAAKMGSSIFLALASPAQGTVLHPEDNYTITVNASDSVSDITRVLFVFNGINQFEIQDTVAPFSISYTFSDDTFNFGSNGVSSPKSFAMTSVPSSLMPSITITAFNAQGESKQILANVSILDKSPTIISANRSRINNSNWFSYCNYKLVETTLSEVPPLLSAEIIQEFKNSTTHSSKCLMTGGDSFYLVDGIVGGKKYLVSVQGISPLGNTKWSFELADPSVALINATLVIPTISATNGTVTLHTDGIVEKFILEYSSGGANTTVDVTSSNGISGYYQIPNYNPATTYKLRAKTAWANTETGFSAITIMGAIQ